MAKDLAQQFRNFIEKYYYSELLKAAKKGLPNLKISFNKLAKFDLKLADKLLSEPQKTIEFIEAAIKEFDLPTGFVPTRVRIIDLPKSQTIRIRDFRSRHLGKFIAVDGLIRQASDIRPKMTLATFECPGCGTQITIEQKGESFREPTRCACGRKSKFRLIDKKMVDVQRLLVEESPESLEGGEQPKKIAVFLSEDLLDPKLEKHRFPGNKIRVIGVVKEVVIPVRTGGQSTRFDLIVDANSVETIESEFEEIEITKKDEETIKELASRPDIYRKLVSSVVPSIYGYDRIKEALILQLFGGVRKKRADGTMVRGDLHIFLIGDPGTGKSEILKYIATLAPKAKYIAGKGATTAGLTAVVVKDEFLRGWALEAGALVLANRGICCIDEMDKMSAEDRGAMHEGMEQQTVTISKANIQATLRAETSVLAAANPKFGRFDPYEPIVNQIDLPATLINRFDLIFPIRDVPDVKFDEKIAKHMLELQKDVEAKKPEIEPELLRKYIAYAKQNCFPKLTPGAYEELKNFYVNLRGLSAAETGDIKAVPISARQLQALVRLAEASARIRLSDKVAKKDAERAIDLLKVYMKAVGTDPETGKFDIDRITTGVTATQRSRIAIVRKIIEELEERFGRAIPIFEVIKAAEEEGVERDKVDNILEELKKKGDIFEPKAGLIQKIG